MRFLRQWGSGLLYALVSVVLVVGGLSLALAEGGLTPNQAAPTQPDTTIPPPSLTAIPPSQMPTTAVPPSPIPASATSGVQPSATPQVIYITATGARPSSTITPSPRATATYRPPATPIACGPYSGWLRSYTVNAGDTLFHISTLYRTTVSALQTANCLTTTFIFPGEKLWVPNVPTITPGITLPPSYATATAYPTLPLTLTPLPFTETVAPTAPPTESSDP
jgi:hypothetical protein